MFVCSGIHFIFAIGVDHASKLLQNYQAWQRSMPDKSQWWVSTTRQCLRTRNTTSKSWRVSLKIGRMPLGTRASLTIRIMLVIVSLVLFFFFTFQHLLVATAGQNKDLTRKKKRDSQPTLLLSLFIFVQFLGVFNPCGYQGVPCLILLVNNVVSYVGSPGEGFERALSNSLDAIAMTKEEWVYNR